MIKAIFVASAVLLTANPANAQSGSAADNPFGLMAVSGYDLSQVRGTYARLGSLSRESVLTTVQRQSRDDFYFRGALLGGQMDVWWGTVGSQLIADSVRSSH